MWILILMILIIPYEKNPYLYLAPSLLGVIPDFTVIKLLGLIGLAWAMMRLMGDPEGLRLFGATQVRVFGAYVGVALLSGLFSGANPIWFFKDLSILFFLPIILAAVRTERDLDLVLKACVISILLAFLYAIRQMLRYEGRLGVGLTDPNYYALWVVLILPLAFMAARSESDRPKKLFWSTVGGLLIVNVLMTASRGAFLGLLLIIGLLVYWHRGRRMILAAAAVGGLVSVVLASSSYLATRLLASGLDESVHLSSVSRSDAIRLALLYSGLRMIADHPITGVGLGNFGRVSQIYTGIPKDKIAHNTYLEVAAEFGLPVLAMFLFFLYVVFRSLRRSGDLAGAFGREGVRNWTLGLRIGLAGYLIPATFLSAQYEKFFWLFIFLSICIERIVQEQRPVGEGVVLTKNVAQGATVIGVPRRMLPGQSWNPGVLADTQRIREGREEDL